MAACGSTDRVGPFLVSSNHPITDASSVDQKMLILNLENKPPAAIEEIAAAYRRQILRKDFADRVEVDGWRLGALNVLLNAASLLPGIKKAFAGAE